MHTHVHSDIQKMKFQDEYSILNGSSSAYFSLGSSNTRFRSGTFIIADLYLNLFCNVAVDSMFDFRIPIEINKMADHRTEVP